MKFIRSWSLDIVLGALASLSLAAKLINPNMDEMVYLVLGLAVFAIYGFDGVMDAIQQKKINENEGESFKFKHRKKLLGIFSLIGLLSFGLALLYIDKEIIYFGLILSFWMLLYFAILFIPLFKGVGLFKKEIWVSLIYTAGIWGIPFSQTSTENFKGILPICLSFLFLVLSNVYIFVYYEKWNSKLKLLIAGFLFTSLILFLVGLFLRPVDTGVYIILLLMNISLASTLLFEDFMKRKSIYGFVADAAFIIPGLIWIFS